LGIAFNNTQMKDRLSTFSAQKAHTDLAPTCILNKKKDLRPCGTQRAEDLFRVTVYPDLACIFRIKVFSEEKG
jgi:hypothetical protein